MEEEEYTFCLPRTKLYVTDSEMIKRSRKGVTVSRYPLSRVSKVHATKRVDPFASGVVVVFAALAVIAKLYIPSAGWGWVACVVCAVIALIALAVIKSPLISVTLHDSEVRYSVNDDADECAGFAASVNALLAEQQESSAG